MNEQIEIELIADEEVLQRADFRGFLPGVGDRLWLPETGDYYFVERIVYGCGLSADDETAVLSKIMVHLVPYVEPPVWKAA